jgi:hypothetical protein
LGKLGVEQEVEAVEVGEEAVEVEVRPEVPAPQLGHHLDQA